MSLSPEAIDRIVANVLSQLSAPATAAPVKVPTSAPTAPRPAPLATPTVAPAVEVQTIRIDNAVIVADVLQSIPAGSTIVIGPKALITPAARDVIKSSRLTVQRGDAAAATTNAATSSASATPQATTLSTAAGGLLIVVRNSKPLEQLWSELTGTWRRELVGCPDDAAKLAIAEVSRGGASQVLIIADQAHRAACLANRNDKVKAVAIRDAGDVRLILRQLRANTWCLDAQGKTYFELKNILRELQR